MSPPPPTVRTVCLWQSGAVHHSIQLLPHRIDIGTAFPASFTKSLLHNGVNDWEDVSKLLTTRFGNSCNPDGMSWAEANREEMNRVLAELVD